MAEIVTHIKEARDQGTINVYALRYHQRGKADNCAVALPGTIDDDLRNSFCENVIAYKDAREAAFNPVSDGLEDGTYEFVSIEDVQDRWDEILCLINDAFDYRGAENRKKVPYSNLYICALDYDGHRYYLCAKQGNSSDKLLKGRIAILENQDKLTIASPNKVFLLSSYVGFLIDPVENKVLIFDKKVFQDVFKYDDFQKKKVQQNIGILDQWEFLSSVKLIKNRCSQKNVYGNLAKIFSDQIYMEQIKSTTPDRLKANLLTGSPKNFTESDFEGNQLVVTAQNLDIVMKMLARGFKFNFFTNVAEEQ